MFKPWMLFQMVMNSQTNLLFIRNVYRYDLGDFLCLKESNHQMVMRWVCVMRSCIVDLLDRPPSLKECPPLRSEWLPILKESNHKLGLLCEVSGFLITGIEPRFDLLCEMSGFLITGIEPQDSPWFAWVWTSSWSGWWLLPSASTRIALAHEIEPKTQS